MKPQSYYSEPLKVLTIAGSDSGGAAGLQADLKTFTVLNVYGMSVVTAVTAQNSLTVTAVQPLPADFVAAQLDAVLSDYGADGVKTGFIGRADLVEMVAGKLREYQLQNIIIDPVLVNHRGQAMFPAAVTVAYIAHLLPLADLVTPNRHEAALLAGLPAAELTTISSLETAATEIYRQGAQNILITGIHQEPHVIDLFFDGSQTRQFSSPWLETQNSHGSGDTLSAAICAFLAVGDEMITAVAKARRFTAVAIAKAATWQLGRGHGPLAQWLVTNNH